MERWPASVRWMGVAASMAAAVWIALHELAWSSEQRGLGAIAEALESRLEPGDLIAVTPAVLAVHAEAFPSWPVVGVRADTDLARLADSGFRRVWLVGPASRVSAAGSGVAVVADGFAAAPVLRADLGSPNPHLAGESTLGFSWLDQAEPVVLREGAAPEPCSPEPLPHTWRCGPETWQTVGPRRVVVAAREQWCIWAHPIAGATIAIRLPAGDGRPRSLFSALAASAVSRSEAPDIEIALDAGGESTLRFVHPFNRSTLQTPIPELPVPIWLQIGVARESANHFCFEIGR